MEKEIKDEVLKETKTTTKSNTTSKPKTQTKKSSGLKLDDVKEISKTNNITKKAKAEEKQKEEAHAQKVRKANNDKRLEEQMRVMIQKRKRKKTLILSSLVVFIFLIIFSTIFALLNLNNDKILKNISVGNVSISSMSKEEAINNLMTSFYAAADKPITLKLEDYSREITPNEIDFEVQSEKTVSKAYNVGRSTNIFSNNFDILSSYFKKRNFDIEYNYDRQLLEQILKDVSVKIPGKTMENTWTVKKDKLVIIKGEEGVDILSDDLSKQILNSFLNLNTDTTVNIPTKATIPEPINIEKISTEITKEAKDATFNKKTKHITPEVNGVKLGISLSEAKKMLSEDKDKYTIPLKISAPKITTQSIKNKYDLHLFNDILSQETTYYDATNINRSINLEVSSRQINGTVLLPGHEFSFNSFVGNTVASDGYKLSLGYAGGKAVPMMGGGVCQISSAIYATALKLDLRITERFNHVCPVSYLPPGLDAATALGSCDLRFINNRKHPIKIVIKSANGVSTVQILGVKEENEPVIKLTSTKLNNVPFTTSYVYDGSLKRGEEQIEIQGLAGFTSKLYKETYVNGMLTNKELVSIDTYKPLHQVIRRNK